MQAIFGSSGMKVMQAVFNASGMKVIQAVYKSCKRFLVFNASGV